MGQRGLDQANGELAKAISEGDIAKVNEKQGEAKEAEQKVEDARDVKEKVENDKLHWWETLAEISRFRQSDSQDAKKQQAISDMEKKKGVNAPKEKDEAPKGVNAPKKKDEAPKEDKDGGQFKRRSFLRSQEWAENLVRSPILSLLTALPLRQ